MDPTQYCPFCTRAPYPEDASRKPCETCRVTYRHDPQTFTDRWVHGGAQDTQDWEDWRQGTASEAQRPKFAQNLSDAERSRVQHWAEDADPQSRNNESSAMPRDPQDTQGWAQPLVLRPRVVQNNVGAEQSTVQQPRAEDVDPQCWNGESSARPRDPQDTQGWVRPRVVPNYSYAGPVQRWAEDVDPQGDPWAAPEKPKKGR